MAIIAATRQPRLDSGDHAADMKPATGSRLACWLRRASPRRWRCRPLRDGMNLYAVDLLVLDGVEYCAQPLEARKARLDILLAGGLAGLQFNEQVTEVRELSWPHLAACDFVGATLRTRVRPVGVVDPENVSVTHLRSKSC
jgi:hypothetical protein